MLSMISGGLWLIWSTSSVFTDRSFDGWASHIRLSVQVSKISLVDLAGSERADSTGATGTRLKVCLPARHTCTHTHMSAHSPIWMSLLIITHSWTSVTAGGRQHQQISDHVREGHLRFGRGGECIFILSLALIAPLSLSLSLSLYLRPRPLFLMPLLLPLLITQWQLSLITFAVVVVCLCFLFSLITLTHTG